MKTSPRSGVQRPKDLCECLHSYAASNESNLSPVQFGAYLINNTVKMVAAWYMNESSEDQREPHKLEPSKDVSLEELAALGVLYWRMDASM